ADRFVEGVIFRQAKLRPNFCELAGLLILGPGVGLVSSAVVVKVELKKLDALVFEIEERAADTAPIGTDKSHLADNAAKQVFFACRATIALPIEPGSCLPRCRAFAASAARGALFNLAEKSLRSEERR